jgi:hypothetical protein
MGLNDIEVWHGNTKVKIDHLWIHVDENFYNLNIPEGSFISFKCKISTYNKKSKMSNGGRNQKSGKIRRSGKKNISQDYRLKGFHSINIDKVGNGRDLITCLYFFKIEDHNSIFEREFARY